jgi:hypothetical protein
VSRIEDANREKVLGRRYQVLVCSCIGGALKKSIGLLILFGILAGARGNADSSAQEITAMVHRALLLSNSDFRVLQSDLHTQGNGQTTYPVSSGLIPRNLGYCNVIKRQNDTALYCWLAGYKTEESALKVYFGSVEAGIPLNYSRRRCESAIKLPCRSWSTGIDQNPKVYVMIARGDNRMFGAIFEIHKRT